MTRRILVAILVVTSLAVAGFGLPLALAVRRLYRHDAVLSLEREATRAMLSVPAPAVGSPDPVELPAPERGTLLGLYSPDGRRLLGRGPDAGDAAVRRAAAGQVSETTSGRSVAVAVPVVSEETVFAVLRAAIPASVVDARVRRAWLEMAGVALFVLAVAAVVATAQARRLARPVAALAAGVTRLGAGDFSARALHSGIAELDDAAAAVVATAARLDHLLRRERAFSAEASHQLRTPLAGLRLRLENALAAPGTYPGVELVDAIEEVDRLQSTITDLLALARDVTAERGPLDLAPVLAELEQTWHGPLASLGRRLRVGVDDDLPMVNASAAALRQVLDVLVANAAEHGSGPISVRARAAATGVAVEVHDEGPGVDGDAEAVFRRRVDNRAGRGLALARSLVEAEGGRLFLHGIGPRPTFSVVLPSASQS